MVSGGNIFRHLHQRGATIDLVLARFDQIEAHDERLSAGAAQAPHLAGQQWHLGRRSSCLQAKGDLSVRALCFPGHHMLGCSPLSQQRARAAQKGASFSLSRASLAHQLTR